MMRRILAFETRLVAAFFAFLASAQAQMAEEATVEKAANDELLWLALLTMLIVLGLAAWQLKKVRKAKRTREHSALNNATAEARAKRDER